MNASWIQKGWNFTRRKSNFIAHIKIKCGACVQFPLMHRAESVYLLRIFFKETMSSSAAGIMSFGRQLSPHKTIKIVQLQDLLHLFFATPHARLKTKSCAELSPLTHSPHRQKTTTVVGRPATRTSHIQTHTMEIKNKTLPRLLPCAGTWQNVKKNRQHALFTSLIFELGRRREKEAWKLHYRRERNTLCQGPNNSDLEAPNQVWRSGSVMCICAMMIIHLTRSLANNNEVTVQNSHQT